MIVTLIINNRISKLTLPEKIRGQFWLAENIGGHKDKSISIEGIDNEWVLRSNKMIRVIDTDVDSLKHIVLKPLSVYVLQDKESAEKLCVFTEPVTEDRQIFNKYLADKDMELLIGRNDSNDIVYANRFVSSRHAKLSLAAGKWFITDLNSANGTFVNGVRTDRSSLKTGDVVYIMGFTIVIGKSFIALNNPDRQVQMRTGKLKPFIRQQVKPADDAEEYELASQEYFYRSPRFKRDIERVNLKIDSPPQNAVGEEMPMILVIGPSMTMGMASVSTAIFAINNAMSNGNISAAMPSVVMSASMLLGTVLWPVISKNFERKRKHKKEGLRQKKYREYLDRIAARISEECEKQEEILRENYVTVSECESRIMKVSRNLWERGPGQNDFLRLRVGFGEGLLEADISYPDRKFSIDDDNLQEELYAFCEKPKRLKNIPITYSLFDDYISGIIGERKQVIEFAKGLIFQLAALYSYDEVKLVFIYDGNEESDFEFVKWLPHVWSNDNKFRFIATNNIEVKEVSSYIEKEIDIRLQINKSEMEYVTPYYIIFAMSRQLSVRAEMLKKIYAGKENINISVVTLYDELKNIPKECSMVAELRRGEGKLFDKDDISGNSATFIPDISLTQDPNLLSIQLSNILLDTLSGSFKLPSMVTFLEMFGVGKVEHLNALTRWKENDPTKSLEAAVGIDALGGAFKLDLHERFHGPHGLVAGMTGSGKSEFIITYILSLAVNYHPYEVAFILIDYKGGGMAKSFEKLPHTAGIITNLDGTAIKRSLVSIESELKRRQDIFVKVSKQIGVSNIDIYKYQKLYREGKVHEPLQHLFIISDEFAELKAQQPEFMTQLVSAARIGRSLGVHLILATQKPSGVVDDQIWSNSKFRICLRVQERADSMDMLKRADAAELTDTGRFYLQVGYNELFEMGQSAWAGAPYYPSDRAWTEKDNSVSVIDRNGRPVKQVKIDNRRAKFGEARKQLDVITDYLQSIAEEEDIKIRPLWLEPIPPIILLDMLREKYRVGEAEKFVLNPVIGEYDNPAGQQQCLLRLPISQEGNTVVYGAAGSGKTSFLNTMVYSLIREHTPEEVNIYILDFASETLTAFAKAPHVGDVILSYESEKVSNLFRMIQGEIEKRKKLFSDYGGDYRSYINYAGASVPSIVIAVNNFAAFTEIYEEKEEAVVYLSREGTKYGIYFVLTSLSTGGVRFRMLQNFRQLIVLQLNDETDYSTVVGKTDGLYPSKYKGRGLVKRDYLYEFQIASLSSDTIPYSFIQKSCLKLLSEWKGTRARKVPVLPGKIDITFLEDYFDADNKLTIPIGVEKNTLKVHYYPFGNAYISVVMSSGSEYQNFIGNLVQLIKTVCKIDIVVLDAPQALKSENAGTEGAYFSSKECEAAVSDIFDIVLYRNNTYKEALEKGIESEKFESKFIIINSISSLKSVLSDEAYEKLSLILEKGEAKYNINIVIGEQVKAIAGLSFERWYKKHITQSDGIWVGSGITEQYQLKANSTTSEMHEALPLDFGYSLQKGSCTRIKFMNLSSEAEDDRR